MRILLLCTALIGCAGAGQRDVTNPAAPSASADAVSASSGVSGLGALTCNGQLSSTQTFRITTAAASAEGVSAAAVYQNSTFFENTELSIVVSPTPVSTLAAQGPNEDALALLGPLPSGGPYSGQMTLQLYGAAQSLPVTCQPGT